MPAPSAADLEAHRTGLTGHCYRMLGSLADADDAVQETMLRAWRALDGFDGRSSLRTWIYRIATNVCLDVLGSAERRRTRPMLEGPAGTVHDALTDRPREHWLEPVPDARTIPAAADPAERAILKQSIRLAFVAALQLLPPRQRAALLLVDVLGWSAAETAASLEMTVAAVNSALQRARAGIADAGVRPAEPLGDPQRQLLERYVNAFERYDIDQLVLLLREDATFSMPPYELWLQGRAAARDWMLGMGAGCRGSRLVPVDASGSPAFGQYRAKPDGTGHIAWGLVVLELEGPAVSGVNTFLDTATLFPAFGLPLALTGP